MRADTKLNVTVKNKNTVENFSFVETKTVECLQKFFQKIRIAKRVLIENQDE